MTPHIVRGWFSSFVLALALACAVASGAGAQQPDTASSVHRVLERFDRYATVRVRFGGRSLTGQVTRLAPDSLYVQGFDWPTAVPLARIDSLWLRIPGDEEWKKPAIVSGVVGALLGVAFGGALCGYSEGQHDGCLLPILSGAAFTAALFGGATAFIAGLGSAPARWERRYP